MPQIGKVFFVEVEPRWATNIEYEECSKEKVIKHGGRFYLHCGCVAVLLEMRWCYGVVVVLVLDVLWCSGVAGIGVVLLLWCAPYLTHTNMLIKHLERPEFVTIHKNLSKIHARR